MKIPILLLAFIVVATMLHAQNPRIETLADKQMHTYNYTKGSDSIRFTIVGKNDTMQTTEFYRNGKASRFSWKKDSIYMFDELGNLSKTYYEPNKSLENTENFRVFFPNGQLYKLKSFKNQVQLEQYYASNGRLVWSETIVHAPDYSTCKIVGENNTPIQSYRVDTLMKGKDFITKTYDTLYYTNGKPFSTEVRSNKNELFMGQYFNADGSLNKTMLPDSLSLIVFKDNVDCYYGLKNRQGDTIVKPRFDRIELLENDYWQAYTGESCILLQLNGAPMSMPFSNLSDIQQVQHTIPFNKNDNRFSRMRYGQQHIDTTALQMYYAFTDGDKHGIMTPKGDIILPPQYFKLSNRYLGNSDYFAFYDREENSFVRVGYLNRQGKPLFSDEFKSVVYTYYKDYFFLCKEVFVRQSECGAESSWRELRTIEAEYWNFDDNEKTFGLGQADGTVLLEPNFTTIQHIDNTLFLVSVKKLMAKTKRFEKRDGLIDVQSKRWLLDTTIFRVTSQFKLNNPYFIIENTETNKYGIMDKTGKYILPIVYDSIGVINNEKDVFCLKINGHYQIATQNKDKIIVSKTLYDYLSVVKYTVGNNAVSEPIIYFLAKRRNKWGLIDVNEKVIKPFEYDYASMQKSSSESFLLVKDNQAACFDLASLPNETNKFLAFPTYYSKKNKIESFSVADNISQLFFVNEFGKVIIPPQYKRISGSMSSDYFLVENLQKQKKVIFSQTGQVADFPFNYFVQWADAKSRVMIVKDSTEVSYGVVSTDGKLLIPCNNYGIAIGDIDASVFFVKRDTPSVKRAVDYWETNSFPQVNKDSFNIEDQNWLMYDSTGKLLSETPFRFPIRFQNGLGIGAKDAVFNLYKTDGSVVSFNGVQDFKNAQFTYEREGGYYTFFYNQGMTPTLILAKINGDVLIDKGRYDGISAFYYQYALVSKAGKIGLVDTLGKEIIPPQYLLDFGPDFIDSLDIEKQEYLDRIKTKKYVYYRDKQKIIDFNYENWSSHPDSLNLTKFQKSVLWNLMLQKSTMGIVQTASDLAIPRVKARQTAHFLFFSSKLESKIYTQPRRIKVADSTMAFVLKHYHASYSGYLKFYNFYRKNNRWEELNINDLLQVQGEKRWLLNDLMTKKIKALKDQEIDCSNASAFITTVENRFMLTKTGVDFCFDSTKGGRDFVVVSFTWAELTPFLKMRIY